MSLSPSSPTLFNLTRQWVEFPSDTLVRCAETLSYIVLLISLSLYTITVWVIVKCSPRLMEGYRWYLLLNVTAAISIDIMYTLIGQINLLPYPIIIYNGWLLRTQPPLSPVVLYSIQLLYATILLLTGCSIVTLFAYRYCQLKENWLYRWVLRNVPFTVGLNILMASSAILISSTPPGLSYAAINERSTALRDAIGSIDNALYERIKGKNVMEYLVGLTHFVSISSPSGDNLPNFSKPAVLPGPTQHCRSPPCSYASWWPWYYAPSSAFDCWPSTATYSAHTPWSSTKACSTSCS